MIGIRLFKSISCALTLMILSPLGHADEACEMFLGRALNQMFSTIESNPEQEDSELRALVQANVDTLSIARFTLGKYATQVSPNDLLTYSRSLNGYFLETIHDNIRDGKHLSADILKSFDRNHRDCIVETVIHRESLEDLTVVWRVMRVGEQHQILDIAPVQNGNTIWLAIELRAQVVDLYERSDGDLDLVIRKLGIG